MSEGLVIITRRKKGKQRIFKRKYKLNRLKNPKREAAALVRNELGIDTANVKQIAIPDKLIKHTENKFRVKFDKKPRLFMYFPKRGRRFGKKKSVHDWAGIAVIPQTKKIVTGGEVHKCQKAFVIMPKSHFKDDHVKNAILLHELGEVLAIQEETKQPTSHMRAVLLERGYEQKIGTTRTGILNKARHLYNDPESWK